MAIELSDCGTTSRERGGEVVGVLMVIAACAAHVVVALPAHGDVVTIVPAQDTTIFQPPPGLAFDLSSGAGPSLYFGVNGQGNARRALLRYDVAGAVPAGATVTSATISLRVDKSISGDLSATLHRVLAPWGEGASDSTTSGGGGQGGGTGIFAQQHDAGWFSRFYNESGPSTPWGAAGGDMLSAPSGTALIGFVGSYVWPSSAGMVADVQSWLDDPATNFGWLIKGDEAEVGGAKRIGARENADPSRRPLLTITFAPGCDAIDFNGDGVFPDNQDLVDFLDVFAGGACPTGTCGDLDFNNDGVFPDNADVASFISRFAGGAC